MRRIYFSFILLVLVWNLTAFQNNETLIYDIKYGMITAGESSLSIEESTYKDSIDIYRILSIAKTNSFFDNVFKVRDKIESIWRKDDMQSLRFTKKLKEGKYRQHRIHFYYPEQGFTIYTKFGRKTKKAKEKRMEIQPFTQDILSAFYYFRYQDFAVGDTVTVNVTADGRSYRAKIIGRKLVTIETIFGNKECIVAEPIIDGEAIFKQTGKILIWVTNDEYKIPVKLSSKIVFGSFKAILKDAKNVPYKIVKNK
ncbi:MAG: hypothetical protein DRI23_10650 [Candidatus Cloacimonadota bacterium]|nr:MAG: hypothetical protein DRI23_10650 [Candidatus Cloacimonadota bacterium]